MSSATRSIYPSSWWLTIGEFKFKLENGNLPTFRFPIYYFYQVHFPITRLTESKLVEKIVKNLNGSRVMRIELELKIIWAVKNDPKVHDHSFEHIKPLTNSVRGEFWNTHGYFLMKQKMWKKRIRLYMHYFVQLEYLQMYL